MLPILVDPLVKKTRPFSISKGCPQSTSMQDGGHEDQDPEDRHSMSSSPLRLKPSSQTNVARPPIRKVVKTIEPLVGGCKGLHKVSLHAGGSGSHFPLPSHLRRSKPARNQGKTLEYNNGKAGSMGSKKFILSRRRQKYDECP